MRWAPWRWWHGTSLTLAQGDHPCPVVCAVFPRAIGAFRVFRLTRRTISAGPSGFSAERVTVVSTLSTQPLMVADDLRRQTDVFIDLAELKPKVGRDPADRPGSREMHQQFLARGTIKRDDWVE